MCDPCPIVRVTTIQGVTKVCNVFWEVIPAATISAYLNKLAHDLAWDGASSEVRVAVLKVHLQICLFLFYFCVSLVKFIVSLSISLVR